MKILGITLLPDTEDSSKIEGANHLIPQTLVHLIVSVIVHSYTNNMYWVMVANWITVVAMFGFWWLQEHLQERAMVKKQVGRVYSFSDNRKQDIALPTAQGILISIGVTLWWLT